MINFTFDGTTVSVEGGALEISKDAQGLKIKFNRTPNNAWSTANRKIGSDFGVTLEDASSHVNHAGNYALGSGRPDWLLPDKINLTGMDYDPHWYKSSGSNGYTVNESVTRAYNELVYSTWSSLLTSKMGNVYHLRRIIYALIVNGHGRDTVYRLAGRVANAYDVRKSSDMPAITATEMLNRVAFTEGYNASLVK